MKKKLIASILAAVMVVSVVPATAFAAEAPAKATVKAGIVWDQNDPIEKAAGEVYATIMALPSNLTVALYDDVEVAYEAYTKASLQVQEKLEAKAADAVTKLNTAVATMQGLKKDAVVADLADIEAVTADSFVATTGVATKAIKAYDELKDVLGKDVQKDLDRTSIIKAEDLRVLAELETTKQKITGWDGNAATVAKYTINEDNFDKTNVNPVLTINNFLKAMESLTDSQKDLLASYDIIAKANDTVKAFTADAEVVKDQIELIQAIGTIETEEEITKAESVLNTAKEALKGVDAGLKGRDFDTAAGDQSYNALVEATKAAIEKAKGDLTVNADLAALRDRSDVLAKKAIAKTATLEDLNAVYDLYYDIRFAVGDLATAVKNDTELQNNFYNVVVPYMVQLGKDSKAEDVQNAIIAQFVSNLPDKVTVDNEKAVWMANRAIIEINKHVLTDTTKYTDAYKDAMDTVAAAVNRMDTLTDAGKADVVALVEKVQGLVDDKTSDITAPLFRNKVKAARTEYEAFKPYQIEYAANTATKVQVEGKGVSIIKAIEYLEEKIEKAGEASDAKIKAEAIAVAVEGLKSFPTFDKITIADKDDVYAVRDMYDNASEAVRDVFDNMEYDTGKTYLSALEAAVAAVDAEYVKDIIETIDALKIVAKDAPAADVAAAKEANKAAREAYNALTATQKKLVKNSGRLTMAEDAVDAAERYVADEALKDVAKIDFTKDLTAEDAAKIEAAKAAVDALTDAQKAKLNAANYKTYTDKALPAYEKFVKENYGLDNATVTVAEATYTGRDVKPAVTVADKAGNVIDAAEYVVTYDNNVNAGTAKATVTAKSGSKYTGAKTVEFTIAQADINDAVATGVVARAYRPDAGRTQNPTVAFNKIELEKGVDYTLAFENNTVITKNAKVLIKGMGNFTGTKEVTYKVVPQKATITSAKAGYKSMTIATAKLQGGVKYQYTYRVKGAKTWKTAYSAKTSLKFIRLAKGKTYEVKVRGYKGSGTTFVAGSYSDVRTVKVK